MESEESSSRRQEPRRFSRSSFEGLVTFPSRFSGRSKKSGMSPEAKAHAALSKAVYMHPDHREYVVKGYDHLRYEITAPSGDAVPLNGTRWAVYRAPTELRYVLAFRGTKGLADFVSHDISLINTTFGKHKYMKEAAKWSLQVMLFLAKRHGNDTNLKFSLTGHSLGGTVAMGVLFLLHDVPLTAEYLEAGREEDQNSGGLPDHQEYVSDFLHPWNAAKEEMARESPPYEIVGGDIFNPGAWPRLSPGYAAAVMGYKVAGAVLGSTTAVLGLAYVAVRARQELQHMTERRHDRDAEAIDQLITTHHILGDLLSENFGLGKEKSYGTHYKTPWARHHIDRFLKEERATA